MANDLVSPEDLADFPGAPFPPTVVDAAVGALRGDAGWHIAPEREETLLVDSEGGCKLLLPTMRLTAVAEVRNMLPDTPEVIENWRKSVRGTLSLRWSAWPCGDESVEVDITHGYTETPPELLIVVAQYCQFITTNSTVRQESAGGESISYASSLSPDALRIFNRFKLHTRF